MTNPRNLPVTKYWESSEKAQSHTQRWVWSLNTIFGSMLEEKSAVCQIFTVVSAEVVASKLNNTKQTNETKC